MAEQIEPGDRIVFYVTGVKAFGGIVRVTSEMFEDRTKVWPGKPGKADAYPWRFATEPLLVLDEDDVRARRGACVDRLEHARQVARRALDAGLPGPAADRLRGRRRAAGAADRAALPATAALPERMATVDDSSGAGSASSRRWRPWPRCC